jgi:hypothetical protein
MDVILDSEWLKDWLTADQTAVNFVRPNVVNFQPYRIAHGVEEYLLAWMLWNKIPVAELPARDSEIPVDDNKDAPNSDLLQGIVIRAVILDGKTLSYDTRCGSKTRH